MLSPYGELDSCWTKASRRVNSRTPTWACTYCPDKKTFLSADALLDHGKSTHQNYFPAEATEEETRRHRIRYEMKSIVIRTPKIVSPSAKNFSTQPLNSSAGISPKQTKNTLFTPLRAPNRGTPHKEQGARLPRVIGHTSDDESRKVAVVGDGSHSAASTKSEESQCPPKLSQAQSSLPVVSQLDLDETSEFQRLPARRKLWTEQDQPASGPAMKSFSTSSNLFGADSDDRYDVQRPVGHRKQLWIEQDATLTRSSVDPSNIASIQAQKARKILSQPRIRKPYQYSSAGTPSTPSDSNKSTSSKNLFSSVSDDSYDIILQPEPRPISQEKLVAEVKGIYAGLVMVEAKCIEVDNKQAALAQVDPSLPPKLNHEQWQALIALHRTLLHEHHDFFVASQHPSASPALRRLAAKYADPARIWRQDMLSYIELLKGHLPASLQDDLLLKLNFLELAYTMMDILHKANPAFQETWTECLAGFDRHLRIIRANFEDTASWSNLIGQWYSEVTAQFSAILSFVPRVYAKSSTFYRKAVRLSVNGRNCLGRPDSGSEKDVCSEDFANKLGVPIRRRDEDQVSFKLGTMTEIRSIGRILVTCGLASPTRPLEKRWIYVLRKCIAPLIMGEQFIRRTKLYKKNNKHFLVRCPNWFGHLPNLKKIGSPNNRIRFTAEGHALIGLADTGSDDDFMSPECVTRNRIKIDRRPEKRMVIQQADGSLAKTVGQVCVSVKIGLMDEFKMKFHVLPGLSCDAIFCEEFLEQTDGINSLVESPHALKDLDPDFQESPHALNTLVNLGPINAYANRSRRTVARDTLLQEHDDAIVAEIYRRNKAKRVIRRVSDQVEREAMEEAEVLNKDSFDQGHASCAICIQRSNSDSSGG